MKRYEIVKNYVYEQFSKIDYIPVRIAALTHTSQVDACVTFLAIARGHKLERAKITALFHDYAQYIDNCPHSQHAKYSSLHAHNYLESTNLFSTIEIDDICYAISQHSFKDQVDSPLCELIKDADVLARFLENPNASFTETQKKRLLKACADIQVN